jgi:exopolysaccharide biosynthesis polyprenyl glycosylphosphotransferase
LIGWYAAAKRVTDLLVAAVALVLLSPLLLAIGLLVKLTSRGPVLYAQERMGLDGRTFRMLKFRSMRVDAEEKTGAVWAKQGDDRTTLLGSILRKTSLDELPQLWNVLCGEMSLVGPRPERPVFVHQFRKQIPHYMLRHKVKAGITGWAQVNGWRGNTSLRRRIECDLYYIQNWSYALDLKILTLTLWKGFVNKNAY